MAHKKKKKPSSNVIAQNRKVRHEYEILETLEAGISLMGSEVKSLRAGHVSFKEGYVDLRDGEAWLLGIHIAPYEMATYFGHEPERPRRLLLHKSEIIYLATQVEQKGMTVVPVKMYIVRGKMKVQVAIARGKNFYDKRETLRRRAAERDAQREMAAR